MLPSRLVDLQVWDAENGVLFNHLIDQGWQPGTLPFGIDPDAPKVKSAWHADGLNWCAGSGDIMNESRRMPPSWWVLAGRLSF
jgi:hypothetical protein